MIHKRALIDQYYNLNIIDYFETNILDIKQAYYNMYIELKDGVLVSKCVYLKQK